MMMNAARTTCSQWITNQDLIRTEVALERLRVLSTLGCFDDWPDAERQQATYVLDAYTDTLECINREAQTADEAAMIRAQIDSNLELIYAFLVSNPRYLAEPEFSDTLLRLAVGASQEGGAPIERQREVGF